MLLFKGFFFIYLLHEKNLKLKKNTEVLGNFLKEYKFYFINLLIYTQKCIQLLDINYIHVHLYIFLSGLRI